MVVGGIVTANLWGLRMFQVSRTKTDATAWARLTMEKLQDEIHSCTSLQLGSVSSNVFTGLLDGNVQQGSGLLIYPGTNTSSYILYFVNPTDQTLRRVTPTNSVIMASSVIDTQPFSAQDMLGNILTNSANNSLVHITLHIQQAGSYLQTTDSYKFETSVKQRVVP